MSRDDLVEQLLELDHVAIQQRAADAAAARQRAQGSRHCRRCEREIEPGRRAAVPYATTCIRCARNEERVRLIGRQRGAA